MLVLFIPCNLNVGLENEVGFLGGFSSPICRFGLSRVPASLGKYGLQSSAIIPFIFLVSKKNTEKREKEEKGLIYVLRFNGKRSFFPNFI